MEASNESGRTHAPLVQRIGGVLKKRRADIGYTLERLADESGVNRATIHAIERGRANPCVGTLAKLCNALRCKLVDLLA